MMVNNRQTLLVRSLEFCSPQDAKNTLDKIGVDAHGVLAMLSKTQSVNILISKQESKIANIIKQEMLSVGGDAAVARGVIDCSVSHSDILIIGSHKQVKRFCEKLTHQPFGLNNIANEIKKLLANITRDSFSFKTARREILLGKRTLIMGILNITPDSFSDGGSFLEPSIAIDKAIAMIDDGADIIDIGGESSRPGAIAISKQEEMDRVLPIIEGISSRADIPISIDTTKSAVAEMAIRVGAEIVNDISALTFDAKMIDVVSKNKAGLILMHMRGNPENMQKENIVYDDIIGDITGFLQQQTKFAVERGVGQESIIIDPGIGFGKKLEDNLNIIKRLDEFSSMGFPLLIGISRKSFIGTLTNETVAQKRIEGSLASLCVAVWNGAKIARVHDVTQTKKMLAVLDAIKVA
ncbi:MAG: dihydropteroate synthase [Deltaproteobacteria bacterium]